MSDHKEQQAHVCRYTLPFFFPIIFFSLTFYPHLKQKLLCRERATRHQNLTETTESTLQMQAYC